MIHLLHSKDCERYLRNIWERGTLQEHERVYAVYLNDKYEREMHKCICKGAYSSTAFDLREIVKFALNARFDKVVIAHNQPSGNPILSEEDMHTTRITFYTLRALDIRLEDHIIITHDSYFSFKDAGIIAELENECKHVMRKAG